MSSDATNHPGRHGRFDILPEETRTDKMDLHVQKYLQLSEELRQLSLDAQAAAHHCGDIDMDGFFVALKERLAELDEQAKSLLGRGSHTRSGTRDLVAEQSMESFPASDPPASY